VEEKLAPNSRVRAGCAKRKGKAKNSGDSWCGNSVLELGRHKENLDKAWSKNQPPTGFWRAIAVPTHSAQTLSFSTQIKVIFHALNLSHFYA